MYKIFLFLCLAEILFAHQTGLSYVNIQEDNEQKISIVYKKPLSDSKGKDIAIKYPSKCVFTEHFLEDIADGFITQRFKMWCGKKGLTASRIWVDGLVSSDRGVLIRYEHNEMLTQSLLRSTSPSIYLNYKNSTFGLFQEYIKLGVEHILGGYDHLLFVFSLILLALSFKRLLFAISAFTLSHSLTLTFGILGIVNIGVLYVEAMIALSILFLAREIMIKKDTFTKRHLGITAFIFGLLHGLGFSSVLRSIGLPQDDMVLALLAFNIGIELGQLLFIFAVGFVFLLLKRKIDSYENISRKVMAYGIGALSAYWFIDRVLAF